MVWFAVGTLRELATAIRALRSALAKRQMLNPDSSPWKALRAIEDRWENEVFFRDMRNIAAFHVDSDVVERGLVSLEEDGVAILSEGEGPKQDRSTMRLGLEALLKGSGKDLADFDRFMSAVGEDQGIAFTIQEAFMEALDKAGVTTDQEQEEA